jgi:hypothetical protein
MISRVWHVPRMIVIACLQPLVPLRAQTLPIATDVRAFILTPLRHRLTHAIGARQRIITR